MSKIGVLLMNIGTPSGSDVASVQKYLSEFLTDKDVINAPAFIREFVFRLWIVPRRAPASALKYQAVWTPEGSPLMVYSKRFCLALQKALGEGFVVKIGMRYGTPSIRDSLEEMKVQGISKILLVPLYPQFAQATTGSSVGKAEQVLKEMAFEGSVQVMPEFYDQSDFIKSWQEILSPTLGTVDHWLFSFHGLPIRQIKKVPGCTQEKCCDRMLASPSGANGLKCYKAQCLNTAKRLAQALDLNSNEWTVSFQSRLGPVKWIEPYTDKTLIELAQRGVKRLAVCAPAFVVDGLETLEELNIEGRKTFLSHGGQEFKYIECLNDHPSWVQHFAGLLQRSAT
ncbi:MAG: ferrochelatase [Bdellovibrionaceae bacterium]|nr:ferrochelatase [Pseudobdellovibrionaceae bacterium]